MDLVYLVALENACNFGDCSHNVLLDLSRLFLDSGFVLGSCVVAVKSVQKGIHCRQRHIFPCRGLIQVLGQTFGSAGLNKCKIGSIKDWRWGCQELLQQGGQLAIGLRKVESEHARAIQSRVVDPKLVFANTVEQAVGDVRRKHIIQFVDIDTGERSQLLRIKLLEITLLVLKSTTVLLKTMLKRLALLVPMKCP